MTNIEKAEQRMKKAMEKGLTPLQAIKWHCMDCCAMQLEEVKLCPCHDCPLWKYRLGANPNRKGTKKNASDSKGKNSKSKKTGAGNSSTGYSARDEGNLFDLSGK